MKQTFEKTSMWRAASEAQPRTYQFNDIEKKPYSGAKVQNAFYQDVCPMSQFANFSA